MRFEYRIRHATTGRVLVEADSTQVFFDYLKGASFAVPEGFREAVARGAADGGADGTRGHKTGGEK